MLMLSLLVCALPAVLGDSAAAGSRRRMQGSNYSWPLRGPIGKNGEYIVTAPRPPPA